MIPNNGLNTYLGWFFLVNSGVLLMLLGAITWIIREMLRWRRMTDQHNMMWAEFARKHGIPFNPDQGHGVIVPIQGS